MADALINCRAAFDALAKRGGGLSVLHWGMGTRTAEPIDAFVKLFGACHGGPDRKFIVAEAVLTPVSDSPCSLGLPKFKLRDEFYYRLKRAVDDPGLWPALLAKNRRPGRNGRLDLCTGPRRPFLRLERLALP